MNGRDWRGHFALVPDVGEPCPHSCCQGQRQHPPGTPRKPTKASVLAELARLEDAKRQAEGRRRRSARARPDPIREAWAASTAQAWAQAEDVTHGYMTTGGAKAKGHNGGDFYGVGGKRLHEKHASNELREAWDHGLAPRPVSLAQFRRQAGAGEQAPEGWTPAEPEPAGEAGLDHWGQPVTTVQRRRRVASTDVYAGIY